MSQILRWLEFLQATDVYESLECRHRRAVLLSAGGPQCGKVWSELPPHSSKFMDNDHFKIAMFMRLGAPQRAPGAVCQMPKKGDQEKCLAALDEKVVHPFLCKCGPAKLRPHGALCKTLAGILRKTGAYTTQKEQCHSCIRSNLIEARLLKPSWTSFHPTQEA